MRCWCLTPVVEERGAWLGQELANPCQDGDGDMVNMGPAPMRHGQGTRMRDDGERGRDGTSSPAQHRDSSRNYWHLPAVGNILVHGGAWCMPAHRTSGILLVPALEIEVPSSKVSKCNRKVRLCVLPSLTRALDSKHGPVQCTFGL